MNNLRNGNISGCLSKSKSKKKNSLPVLFPNWSNERPLSLLTTQPNTFPKYAKVSSRDYRSRPKEGRAYDVIKYSKQGLRAKVRKVFESCGRKLPQSISCFLKTQAKFNECIVLTCISFRTLFDCIKHLISASST